MRQNVTTPCVILGALLASASLAQIDQRKSPEEQIEEALSALPESLREGVRVKGFDDDGELVVLRDGPAAFECRADDPSVRAWQVVCYPPALEALVVRSAELTKDGADTPARIRTLAAEIASGAIEMPTLGALYMRSGNTVSTSSAVTLIHVPNADAREAGLPALPTRGAPWMAESGTPMAHIRVGRR